MASSYCARCTSIRVVAAHACPACTHTPIAAPMIAAGFASSSTIATDLPPSSRNIRFMVSTPCHISSFPTAVDPVMEIMSTRGSVPSSLATSLYGVGTTFTTPAGDVGVLGDQPAHPRGVPRNVRVRFEHNGIAGGKRRPELVEDHLDRKIGRGDG